MQEHSMLYKLSPIQKHQEQIWPCNKNGQGQPRVIIWKKPQGMGIQPLGTSSGRLAFIIPIILYQFQKDPFCLIILYDILFYFIHVYKAPGQEETTLGDIFFFMQAERSYHFDHWMHVSKQLLILCTCFHDFIHEHSPWAEADNPLGPNFLCQQEGLMTMVICFKFKKILFHLWLNTHHFMYIAIGQGQTTPGGHNFDVNRNLLSFQSFATSFKKIS